ncbi:MAG: hypothetical protein VM34scaffold347_2 [Phage 66_12]|nr:MAG: hypothetical protein VM34scaffold347_2 [Phage 66_12]
MPQLNQAKAAQVDSVENRGGVLEPGVYELKLKEVEARPGKTAPLWTWVFEIPQGLPGAGRTFFHNTSLSDAADWKLQEAFNAFGVPSSTDTDVLIGRRVKALVTKNIAEQGKRQGQFVNSIQELLPAATKATAPSPGAVQVGPTGGAGQKADDEPPF